MSMTGDRAMRATRATAQIKAELLEKIQSHTAMIGVVGLGYVGLPFAVEKARVGFNVVGFEMNPAKAESVNKGQNYIPDVEDAMLAELVQEGRLSATSGMSFPVMEIQEPSSVNASSGRLSE